MKSYLEDTIDKVEKTVILINTPKVNKLLDNAKAIINDPKFMEQKGVRSIVDQDARVGHKSNPTYL